MEALLLVRALASESPEQSSESSDSENSDEDLIDILVLNRLHKPHYISNYVACVVSRYSVDEFKAHFRMSRTSFENLVTVLQKTYITVGVGRSPVCVKTALLMTIWTLSNQEAFRTIGDRFGVGRGHAHTIVLKCCKLLTKHMQSYIKWPTNNEAEDNIEGFRALRGEHSFPGVFGCVDGTHIPIPGPKNDNSYYNRKGVHSIILQGICDYRKKFINLYIGWPGSTHDAKVWQNSTVYKTLSQDSAALLPKNTYLIGDSAYPLSTFLIVPFKDNGHLTRQQKIFNQRLSSSRVIIENAFGRLKGTFRQMKYLNVTKIEYAKFFIAASCILHNIAVDDNVNFEEYMEIWDDEVDNRIVANNDAVTLRNNIMRSIAL